MPNEPQLGSITEVELICTNEEAREAIKESWELNGYADTITVIGNDEIELTVYDWFTDSELIKASKVYG